MIPVAFLQLKTLRGYFFSSMIKKQEPKKKTKKKKKQEPWLTTILS
jgi:hypothetical protein